MKKMIILIVLVFSTISLAKDVTVQINGMTCVACVKAVSKELKKLKNIDPDSVKVSVKGSNAVFKTTGEVPDSKIRVAVKKAGYKVLKILKK